MELDYQLGEDIKEKLIPRAIDWFTGEALQFEEVDEDLEEGDFEDEDDEEDDDASEDRDDEEESDEEVRRCIYFSLLKLTLKSGRQLEAQAGSRGVQAELDFAPFHMASRDGRMM